MEYWTAIVPVNVVVDPWPIARPFTWMVWLGTFIIIPVFLLTVYLLNFIFEDSLKRVEWGRIAGFTIRTALVESTSWYPHKVRKIL